MAPDSLLQGQLFQFAGSIARLSGTWQTQGERIAEAATQKAREPLSEGLCKACATASRCSLAREILVYLFSFLTSGALCGSAGFACGARCAPLAISPVFKVWPCPLFSLNMAP